MQHGAQRGVSKVWRWCVARDPTAGMCGRLAAAGGGVGVLAGALGDVEARELLGHGGVDAHRVHQLLHRDAASGE